MYLSCTVSFLLKKTWVRKPNLGGSRTELLDVYTQHAEAWPE